MRYAFMRHASPIVRLIRPVPPISREPISRDYGFDRGTPIDRHYIEDFLARHKSAIQGTVLEIKSADYTKRFGSNVERSDVLDIDDGNAAANVIADLQHADDVGSGQYDCFILTQTLQYVFDLRGALAHSRRILKPGGSLIVTVPTIHLMDPEFVEGEFWRITGAALRKLLAAEFGDDNVTVESHGNYVATMGSLAGMAIEDVTAADLAKYDPQYPLVSCAIATRA